MHNVVSYGAGTQSTALILMGLTGEYNVARPDFAVFTDCGGDSNFVMDYLQYFRDYCKKQFDFDIHIVRKSPNLLDSIYDNRYIYIPAYTQNVDGSASMINRHCTARYKQRPTNQFIKSMTGIKSKKPVERQRKIVNLMMGISYDERERVKISQEWWCDFSYPLVDAKMVRVDSIRFVKRFGLKDPPRSSCVFCPFHNNKYWALLKKEEPEQFARAVDVEKQIQQTAKINKLTYIPYLHRGMKPIDSIEFESNQLGLFEDMIGECSGFCGV